MKIFTYTFLCLFLLTFPFINGVLAVSLQIFPGLIGCYDMGVIFQIKDIEPPGISNFTMDFHYNTEELAFDSKTKLYSNDLEGILCCNSIDPD